MNINEWYNDPTLKGWYRCQMAQSGGWVRRKIEYLYDWVTLWGQVEHGYISAVIREQVR